MNALHTTSVIFPVLGVPLILRSIHWAQIAWPIVCVIAIFVIYHRWQPPIYHEKDYSVFELAHTVELDSSITPAVCLTINDVATPRLAKRHLPSKSTPLLIQREQF